MHANRAQRAVIVACPAAQGLRAAVQVVRSGGGVDGVPGFKLQRRKGRRCLGGPPNFRAVMGQRFQGIAPNKAQRRQAWSEY